MTANELAATEEWRPVAGYDGWYEVSDRGRVRSWKRLGGVKGSQMGGFSRATEPRIFRMSLVKGYPRAVLARDGVNTGYTIHRLVAAAFIGPRPDGMVICHNDGDELNNSPANLRYDTQRGNLSDRHIHGTTIQGEKAGMAKLNNEQVLEIRHRRKAGEAARSLAEEFQMDISSIYDICNRRTWWHI